jgi:hypothetical protein
VLAVAWKKPDCQSIKETEFVKDEERTKKEEMAV